MKLSKAIVIDDDNDIATIHGKKISGQLLTELFNPSNPAVWFRMPKGGADGVIRGIESKFIPPQ